MLHYHFLKYLNKRLSSSWYLILGYPQKKENATTFLEWFVALNYYQITYSQTNEMVASVTKIFNDDV